MYERYLSQEFSNKYNELIANIFYIQEELNSLDNNMDNSNIASILGESFYKVSQISQEFDYFLTNFELVDRALLMNNTSSISSDFGFYFERKGLDNNTSREGEKVNKIKELVNGWVDVISREYPGINKDNQAQIINNYADKEKFVKRNNWKNIIIELDNISKEFVVVSRN